MRSWITTDKHVTGIINGKDFAVARDNAKANDIIRALNDTGTPDECLLRMISAVEAIKEYSNGQLVVEGNVVKYQGTVLAPVLAARLLDCIKNKIPYGYLLSFIQKMFSNPSRRATQELYAFLEHKNLPITPRGTFLAYKAINNDWHDKHSGKFSNAVGNTLRMPRNTVDDDATVGCSMGFHAGSLEYVQSFAWDYGTEGGDRIVIVEIDPMDVVSVPFDCECQKLRTCCYKVVDVFQGELPPVAVCDNSYDDASDPDDYPEFDEDDEDDVEVTASENDSDASYDAGWRDALRAAKSAVEEVEV